MTHWIFSLSYFFIFEFSFICNIVWTLQCNGDIYVDLTHYGEHHRILPKKKRGKKSLAFAVYSNNVRVKQMLKLKCNSIWPWLWKGIRCAYCVVNKTCNVYVNIWELRKKSKTLHVCLEIDHLGSQTDGQ